MNKITMTLQVDHLILEALKEDISSEDVTTNSVMKEAVPGEVDLICKEDGIIAGLEIFSRVFTLLDADTKVELFCKDGSCVADFGAGTLTLPNGAVEHYEEDVNERYLREMNYFLDYAAGEETESLTPPATALQVLKLTLGEQQ